MKNLIGITIIIVFSSVAVGFLIAAWYQNRKDKRKKLIEELFTIPNEMDYALDIGVYHFEFEENRKN